MKQLRTAGLFLLLLSLASFYTNSPAKAIENLPEKAPVPKRDLLLNTENKEEVFDIMSIPNYPHYKPEGLAILNSTTLAIVNDDNFGIVSEKGAVQEKTMPYLGNKQDENIVYFVKLPKSLC